MGRREKRILTQLYESDNILDPKIFDELMEDMKVGNTATPVLAIAELLEELTVKNSKYK